MKTTNYNNRQPDTDITEKSAIDRFFSSKIFIFKQKRLPDDLL